MRGSCLTTSIKTPSLPIPIYLRLLTLIVTLASRFIWKQCAKCSIWSNRANAPFHAMLSKAIYTSHFIASYWSISPDTWNVGKYELGISWVIDDIRHKMSCICVDGKNYCSMSCKHVTSQDCYSTLLGLSATVLFPAPSRKKGAGNQAEAFECKRV